MSDSKHILFACDIGELVGLGALTVARHSRGERFSPTLGVDFPSPFTCGHGTKLRWLSTAVDAWLVRRAAPTPPAPTTATAAPAKRGRGRPPKRLQQQEGGEV